MADRWWGPAMMAALVIPCLRAGLQAETPAWTGGTFFQGHDAESACDRRKRGDAGFLGGQPTRSAWPRASRAPSGQPPVRLPRVDSAAPAGTPSLDARPAPTQPAGGTVYGRLLQKRHPLVNCGVALVPLQKKGRGGYSVDGAGQPLSVTTDDRGVYYFEDVPVGPYKLFWLPQGTNQWIRRVEFKPDVVVRANQTKQIKDIRVALRTIN